MRIKRIIAALAASVMCTAAVPGFAPYVADMSSMTVSAASQQYGDIYYTSDGSSVTITGCTAAVTDLVIPGTIGGLPVKTIGREAFMGNETLNTIVMPDSVEVISSYAFWNCTNVSFDKLPANLKTIGIGAFYRCNHLISVTIPDGVTELPQYSFYWCDNLNKFYAGANLKTIGNNSFTYCDGLVKADLSGVETIGDDAFNDCDLLTDVTITDAIQSIGYRAFYKCPCVLDLPSRVVTGNQRNTYANYYGRTADNDHSFMCETDTGYQLVQVNDNKFFRITDVDASTNVSSSKAVSFELPVWGGVWFSDDYNYAVFGDSNYTQDDSREVVRVVRYSKNWERIDSASLYGSDTYLAFHSGSLRFSEYGGKVYCHASKLKYESKDGNHHQRNLTFVIDKAKMSVSLVPDEAVYASHSFDQFVKADSSGVYYSDLGDAFPRAIAISNGKKRMYEAYPIGGKEGDNYTGVSMNGMELSEDNIIIVASSVDQSAEFDAQGKRNILISVTDKNLTKSTNKFITNYTAQDADAVIMPRLVKQNNDSFFLLWEEWSDASDDPTVRNTKIVKLDGSGNQVSKVYELGSTMPLSDCQPFINKEGCITWFATVADGGNPQILKIDPKNLTGTVPVTTTTTTAAPTTTTTTSSQNTAKSTTSTTAVTTTSTTTTTTQSPQGENEMQFDIAGLVLNPGDVLSGDLTIDSGSIGQVKIKYLRSDGTGAVAFIGGVTGDYLTGPGSKSMVLKATEEMKEISIVMTVSGNASPSLQLMVERSQTLVTTTSTTTATTTTTTTTTSATSGRVLLCGDADLSDSVSVSDIVTILQYCANKEKYPLDSDALANADADADGEVTPNDAFTVQLYDAKMIKSLPYKG